MDYNCQIESYNYLMDTYIEIIHKLINFSLNNNLLPFKIIMGINYLRKYVNENRLEILENSINYLLTYKEIILNFNIEKLDDLDDDSDDNISRKECVNNIKNINNNIVDKKFKENEILELIIEIKNNSKKLSKNDIDIIKKYFELLISILEQIKNIF